jgi:hypothetical protein
MKKNNSKKNFKIVSSIMNWSLRKFFMVLFLALVLQCTHNPKEKPFELKGLWGFLDVHGNYNEAWFDSTSYKTMNRFVPQPPQFNYLVQKDTLFSDVDKRKSGMNPIAVLKWIEQDRVVFIGEFVSDTLYRVKDASIHFGNSDPIKDSANFWPAYYSRYESFLISRGIITEEDARQFRESGEIPDEVLKDMKR